MKIATTRAGGTPEGVTDLEVDQGAQIEKTETENHDITEIAQGIDMKTTTTGWVGEIGRGIDADRKIGS
ncbi:MAG: hypothetical protein Q9170_007386 [Blastenia crenularia]